MTDWARRLRWPGTGVPAGVTSGYGAPRHSHDGRPSDKATHEPGTVLVPGGPAPDVAPPPTNGAEVVDINRARRRRLTRGTATSPEPVAETGLSSATTNAEHTDQPSPRHKAGLAGWAARGGIGLKAAKPPKDARTRAKQRGVPTWLWRFVSGAEVTGRQRTNATWLRFGTKVYDWGETLAWRWFWWPRLLRAAVRWAATAFLAMVAWTHTQQPETVGQAVGAIAWCAIAGASYGATDSALGWPWRRRVVWPVHYAIVDRLGYLHRTPPRRYLRVLRGPNRGVREVHVALPPDWTGFDEDADRGEGERKAEQLVAVIRAKLALNDIKPDWYLAHRNHYLVIRFRRDRVPAKVPFADPAVRRLVEDAPESAPLLGLTEDGRPVAVDFDAESPHMLVTVWSGHGKSKALQGIAAQGLHHPRTGATFLDHKQISHKWAKGLPRVHICRAVEEMHLSLIELAEQGQRRMREAWHWEGDGDPTFDRHLLLIEEANTTMLLLRWWWKINRRKIRPEDIDRYCGQYGDPSLDHSPALAALTALLAMGRQALINVVMVAQIGNARELGGPQIRELFGAARLLKVRQKQWDMLAPEVDYIPPRLDTRGRIQVIRGGTDAVETQLLMFDDGEARAWATAATTPEDERDGQNRAVRDAWVDATKPADAADLPPTDPPAATTSYTGVDLVTLRESVDKGILTTSYHMARFLRDTDPEFPRASLKEGRGRAHHFSAEELRRYDRNRSSRRQSDPELEGIT